MEPFYSPARRRSMSRAAMARQTLLPTATVVLQADATINTVFADSTLTVAGPIAESGGAFSLTKDGPGTLTLTGVKTFTGGTIVNAGTLQLGDDTNTASLAGGN